LSTRKIIDQAQALARDFVERGHRRVRLPVFAYEDWCEIYRRPPGGESLHAFRTQQRRTWYLMRFLGDEGVEVEAVPVKADELLDWAEGGDHDLNDPHELAHAVGEYVNRPQARTSACRHAELPQGTAQALGATLATLTVFGERPEEPEVMSIVLHRPDGAVLHSLEILACQHSPQEAWEQVQAYLDRHRPERVFHDRTVRRPEFCPDCNALLVHVASPEEVEDARRI
jgi:hypothetical protein